MRSNYREKSNFIDSWRRCSVHARDAAELFRLAGDEENAKLYFQKAAIFQKLISDYNENNFAPRQEDPDGELRVIGTGKIIPKTT